jgi:glycosyltransferase involved in cell wall biosynthesis
MTRRSRKILLEQYGVSARKVRIIPHGTPKVSMVISTNAKTSLCLTGRFVLSTFGLIHRGKGIEYAIKALPKIVEREPSVLYLILGRTHPEVWKREGESYRNELMSLVESLGMGDHVRFHDGYLTKRTLET